VLLGIRDPLSLLDFVWKRSVRNPVSQVPCFSLPVPCACMADVRTLRVHPVLGMPCHGLAAGDDVRTDFQTDFKTIAPGL
jgi:hypothetical protein